MKDPQLVELNFDELLNYGGQPSPILYEYEQPIPCQGYCVSCERKGLLEGTGKRLHRMSHGCDSSDFEAVLGPMPNEGPAVEHPILFLLENPGGYYNNGEKVEFDGFKKQPPNKHYYWTPGPNMKVWPSCPKDFNRNFYGPYFAYLMRTHQLKNVYITNLVKCQWIEDEGVAKSQPESSSWSAIVDHCVGKYLTREMKILDPIVTFCFGRSAEKGLRKVDSARRARYLRHPAFRGSPEDMVRQNDKWVTEELREIGLTNIAADGLA